MLEVLAYAEVIRGDVIVKKEVLYLILIGIFFSSLVPRSSSLCAGTVLVHKSVPVAHLSIKHLASGERLVVLDELQYVERHIVVASPRHIRKRVVNHDRHDVNVFFEDRRRVHLKRRPSRQVR